MKFGKIVHNIKGLAFGMKNLDFGQFPGSFLVIFHDLSDLFYLKIHRMAIILTINDYG